MNPGHGVQVLKNKLIKARKEVQPVLRADELLGAWMERPRHQETARYGKKDGTEKDPSTPLEESLKLQHRLEDS
jgi:hypothetical protein